MCGRIRAASAGLLGLLLLPPPAAASGPTAVIVGGATWADAVAPAAQAEAEGTERWKGVVELPGQELEIFVTFVPEPDGEGYSGTIDIPAQGADDLPLVDVVYTEEEIRFTIRQQVPAVFSAERSEDGDTATGHLEQGGMRFPLRMERLEEGEGAAGVRRPQHPRPPFPYEEREVGYSNPADGTRLAGTLTIPGAQGPHPAALLVSGSGAQDRDETVFGHKPFLVLADHLTRNGVAVLRLDDRGVGGSTGTVQLSTSEDFAGDVLAGIAFLKGQEEIDARRIGLIGHSEGGLVAAMAAARSDDVAFVVLLAGTALPGREILPMQLAAIQRALGRPEDNIRRQLKAQRRLLDRLIAGAGEEALREALAELTAVQLSALPADQAPPGEAVAAMIDQGLAELTTPWFRSFLVTDPRRWLRRVRCPVLAVGGSLDLQVPARPNLAAIEQALGEAGNPDVTVVELPGLNHLFQGAGTGSPAEYGSIEETFSPAALALITEWIRQRTGLDG